MSARIKVAGYCPFGCGETLFLADSGRIVCLFSGCSRPYAVAEILEDHETEHTVMLSRTAFTVRHPLRERLDDALLTCQLHEYIAALDGPPVAPGRYRATPDGDLWAWSGVSS